MRPDAVARRYARALFMLADENGILEDVAKALQAIVRILEVPEVGRVLTGPLGREPKRRIVGRIAQDAGAPTILLDFLMLLSDRDRLGSVPGITAVYGALLDQRQNIIRAVVRSATPLSQEVLEDIIRRFSAMTNKRVVPAVDVDEELIAGIVVEIEGRVYDGSVRAQLDRLQRQMAAGD